MERTSVTTADTFALNAEHEGLNDPQIKNEEGQTHQSQNLTRRGSKVKVSMHDTTQKLTESCQ